jgi:hypothetical protein
MSDINYRLKLDEIVDACEKLSPKQKALWHLFSFYASEDENEAIYEVAVESEKNIVFLTLHLFEKVKQLYEE